MPCLSDVVLLSPSGFNAWRPKDPTEYRQYSADFSQVMRSGATIANLAVLSFDPTLVVGQRSFSGTMAQFYFGGGIDGAVTDIAIKVVSTSGETIIRTVQLPVIAQLWASATSPFPQSAPGSSITVTDQTTGNVLDDANSGQPVTLP